MDVGVRWAPKPGLKLVAGVFEVQKPYFTTDESNLYSAQGEVRHRGLEVSLSGTLVDNVSVVAGALLMEPEVSGEAVESGRVGRRAVGQTDRVLRLNLDYRVPTVPAFSLDLAVVNYGQRTASSDGMSAVPDYTTIDIGARYRMKLGNAAATLRVQAANVTDAFAWNVLSSNSFGLTDGRRYTAMLFVDL
jgi:iron complex outermembrane receptor protein